MAVHPSQEPVDIVITWLDNNDPLWQKERRRYRPYEPEGEIIRYRDWDLLKYILRGIEQFAPWVGNIHLVTYGHVPAWLKTDIDGLKIVYHRDFIPAKYLPTFNANPIELHLHRIKGLSERFIYFNDDMFLIAPTPESHFFRNQLPRDEFMLGPIVADGKSGVFPHILVNDLDVINRNFSKQQATKEHYKKYFSHHYGFKSRASTFLSLPYKVFTGFSIYHMPSPFLKTTYEHVWEAEPELLDAVCKNRFRSELDVNQYLIKMWQFLEGSFVPISLPKISQYFSLGDDRLETITAHIKAQKKPLLCINDTSHEVPYEPTKRALQDAFQAILPTKSRFER